MTSDLLHRVHDNFAGAVQVMAAYSGGKVLEEDGLVCYSSSSPSPFPWNGAIRVSGDLPAEEVVRRASAFFGPIGHGFAVGALEGIDDDMITALGEPSDSSPEMVMEHRPDPFVPGDDVEVLVVSTDDHRIDWLRVVSEAFETLGESRETWHLNYPDLESVNNPKTVAMVAYVDEEPAAGGMYYRSGSVIEVLHIGTANDFRRRGLGRAIATALTAHGFDNGATLASLQAEPMGFNTYRRIGYEVVSNYHWYINPTA